MFGIWKKDVDFDPNFERNANHMHETHTNKTDHPEEPTTKVNAEEKTIWPENGAENGAEKGDRNQKRLRAAKRSSRKRKAVTATNINLAGDG